MARCDACGEYESMPYQCRRCGRTFCSEHRLPENHDCPGLGDWNDPGGVFDSGFDDSVDERGRESGGVTSRVSSYVDRQTSTGGSIGFFRGNMTYVFLGLMWVTFLLQFVVFPFLLGIPTPTPGRPSPLWDAAFVLSSTHVEYVWTWVTSVFAHGGFTHIVFNSIALYFFGPVVERRLGFKRFTALFLVSGVLAGLAQIGASMVLDPGSVTGVVGASGAIMAIMGLLTVLRPNLKVYLYFVIPMPLWVLTIGFAVISVLWGFSVAPGGGNSANWAHLAGLVIGFAYGAMVKGDRSAPEQIQFGGPGGPGGPGRGRF
ncbi:rhomboid family intramembrane serine protease [Halorarum halophilum]|uniref:Rhomboid family intramembrane serine protease n=1 Tax=Halorarum halophilum TaxID=2743090 RepID=A0A7D5KGV7_9EURY|nr:rhomboid family intramembrane serine protease [Halobaculum halophilum]QLG28596.1 rhomboid family intramembrane serine protease [Halobaculum halophilum]